MQPVDLGTLKMHFAYSAWASARLVDAAAKLSESRSTPRADNSVTAARALARSADSSAGGHARAQRARWAISS